MTKKRKSRDELARICIYSSFLSNLSNKQFFFFCPFFIFRTCLLMSEWIFSIKYYPNQEIPTMGLNLFRTTEVNFLYLKYLYISLFGYGQISSLPLSLHYIFFPSRICVNGVTFKNILTGFAMILPRNLASIWMKAGFSCAKIELKS